MVADGLPEVSRRLDYTLTLGFCVYYLMCRNVWNRMCFEWFSFCSLAPSSICPLSKNKKKCLSQTVLPPRQTDGRIPKIPQLSVCFLFFFFFSLFGSLAQWRQEHTKVSVFLCGLSGLFKNKSAGHLKRNMWTVWGFFFHDCLSNL